MLKGMNTGSAHLRMPAAAKAGYIVFVSIFFYTVFGLCPMEGNAKKKEPEKAAVAAAHKKVRKDKDAALNPARGGAEKNDAADKQQAEPRGELYTFEKPSVEEQSYTWVVVKTILVLGLLVGGFYYFFKFVTRKTGGPLGASAVQVLSLVPLGQNRFIQIIDLAGKVLVLGITDHAVNLIMEIKEKDEIDRIRLAGSKAAVPQAGGFQDFLSRHLGKILRRRENTQDAYREFVHRHEETEMDRLNYLSLQKERLKRLNGADDE